MNQIPFNKPFIAQEENQAVLEVLQSQWLTTGQQTRSFETEFSDWSGAPHSLAVNSCTAALHLAAALCELKAGDEVVVPSYTFVSTAEVFEYLGCRVRVVDVDPNDLCLNLSQLPASQYENAKVVAPVHLFGVPADLETLTQLKKKFPFKIIQDAAHATETIYKHKHVAQWADFSCFSFYANKNLTTGEGGMLCLAQSDPELYAKSRQKSLHGMDRDAWKRFQAEGSWFYEVTTLGYKYNLTDIAAAMGRVQLKKMDQIKSLRRQVLGYYTKHLAELAPDIEVYKPWLQLDKLAASGTVPAFHLVPVFLKASGNTNTDLERRSSLVDHLKKSGVHCSVHYTPLHRMPYYRDKYALQAKDFPVTESYSSREVSLPFYPTLQESDVRRICDEIKRFLSS